MKAVEHYGPFVGRLLLALIFVMAGLNKIGSYEATQGYMQAFGISGSLLPIVIAFEILAGLALIAGLKTRITAFLLAGFTLLSSAVFHSNFGDPNEVTAVLKNLAIAGGLVLLVARGSGHLAIDRRLGKDSDESRQLTEANA